MKKIILGILMGVMLLTTGCSNKEKMPIAEPDNYLYQIKNNKGNTLYMLGTVHMGSDKVLLDGNLEKVYKKVNTVCFEVLLDDIDSYKTEMEKTLTIHPLTEYKDNEDFKKIWAVLKDKYKSISDQLRPYIATYIQAVALLDMYKELGLDANYSIDNMLYYQAKEDGKKLEQTEDIMLQYNTLAKISGTSTMMILASLTDRAMNEEGIKKSYLNYVDGKFDFKDYDTENITIENIPKEYRVTNIKKELEDYKKLLISSRNDKMYETAKDYVNQNNVLMVVGAGHVLGEDGLLEQFKKDGYTVEKVSDQNT